MQSNSIKPRRMILPQRGTFQTAVENIGATGDAKKVGANISKTDDHPSRDLVSLSVYGKTQEDASITPPSILGAVTDTYDERFCPCEVQRGQAESFTGLISGSAGHFSNLESEQVPVMDNQKKVQFSLGNKGDIHEASDINNHDQRHQNLQHLESDIKLARQSGVSSALEKVPVVQDQLQQFGNFLSHPNTQSSAVGSACTSTLVNSTSAPMVNSITSHSQVAVESLGDYIFNAQLITQGDKVHSAYPPKYIAGISTGETANAVEDSCSVIDSQAKVKKYCRSEERQGSRPKENDNQKDTRIDTANRVKESLADVTDVQSQAPLSQHSTIDLRSDLSKLEKQEKVVSGKGAPVPRKRTYDPDFFKVNGKLYQRLGKIGSGGSSEVHKVISSDCTIYALKKIKLKGRDYATAYGFCQEILYLNKLKGKKNIIQLIDYEVTDKNLIQEVLTCTMSSTKDGRVKDDGFVFMVLEYGEIDLAHMLSQKWKEMDSSNQSIDENWLRFYWQQILQAVNTIHEERIVHSDLKPANFLLVKGYLKLIDFGIAKAIMSDTTNIQRDSQVGTLSYMSPEAFMCNESDTNGNVIKCGRPSDIWSLGCILYQMVYGRTPFSDYKTFWAKFKVITDPNHDITYEPVSNPWLLDLMKKCLAWDRNERWRIPELLQHPFLVPPVTSKLSSYQDQNCNMLKLIGESCDSDKEASLLYLQLHQLLNNPFKLGSSELSHSLDGQCNFLSRMVELCFRLKQHLASSVQE